MRGLLGLPLCLLVTCSQPFDTQEKEKTPEVETPKEWKQPDNATMEQLAAKEPIAFLENCIHRYHRDVKEGYRLQFHKKERIGVKLYEAEEIDVWFREKPHSVLFRWIQGARKAAAALYVEGENDDQMLIRPKGLGSLAGVVKRDPEGADAKKSGRYSLKEFGLKNATLRALASWKTAKAEDNLHVEFLGTEKIKEIGDLPCWVLKRSKYKMPEKDGVIETTLYFDKETWLQVGSVVRAEGGKLVGEYYFREIELNPKFKDNQFEREALTEKKR
jgi:hypothetical protein